MKIKGKVQEFVPVSITLESQDELDMFTTVFHNVGGNRFRTVFGNTSAVVAGLRDLGGQVKPLRTPCSIYID